jgi:hypothetical protein
VHYDIVQASTLADSMSGFDRQLRSILASLRGGLFGTQFQVQKEYVCSYFRTSSSVCGLLTSRVGSCSATYQAIPCIHLREEPEKARRLWGFFQSLEDGTLEALIATEPTPTRTSKRTNLATLFYPQQWASSCCPSRRSS